MLRLVTIVLLVMVLAPAAFAQRVSVKLTTPAQAQPAQSTAEAGEQLAVRYTAMALACVHQEYPNKIAHVLNNDADVKPPRELTPAFFGCYDWHSSVHGHWLLARVARLWPQSPTAKPALAALARSLTAENLAVEAKYIEATGRSAFERPYGLAWLLQLVAELREWGSPQAMGWARNLEPLEKIAVRRLSEWLPKLSRPVRIGEHDQTAFALGLMLDYARVVGDVTFSGLLRSRVEAFYGADRGCPLSWEPSGQDFLSPCLAEADLVRRVVPPAQFAQWLRAFLPSIPNSATQPWLAPVVATDPSDPKLAHLDGLNLSRAWMLEGIAQALPADDPRVPALKLEFGRHRDAAIRAITGEHYEGGHWLGTFAVYLLTRRGLPPTQ